MEIGRTFLEYHKRKSKDFLFLTNCGKIAMIKTKESARFENNYNFRKSSMHIKKGTR